MNHSCLANVFCDLHLIKHLTFTSYDTRKNIITYVFLQIAHGIWIGILYRGVNRSKNPGGPGSKKSGGATYKAEKGGCVIYYISVKKLGWPWPPSCSQCLRPCCLSTYVMKWRDFKGFSDDTFDVMLRHAFSNRDDNKLKNQFGLTASFPC